MVVSKILVISANIGFTAGQIHHKYRDTNYVGKREAGSQKTFKGIIIIIFHTQIQIHIVDTDTNTNTIQTQIQIQI